MKTKKEKIIKVIKILFFIIIGLIIISYVFPLAPFLFLIIIPLGLITFLVYIFIKRNKTKKMKELQEIQQWEQKEQELIIQRDWEQLNYIQTKLYDGLKTELYVRKDQLYSVIIAIFSIIALWLTIGTIIGLIMVFEFLPVLFEIISAWQNGA